MSTPNPTHIDVIIEHRWRDGKGCNCTWFPDYRNTHKSGLEMHGEHVVSKLTDAGYSIMPSEGIVRTYQAASMLGFRYMLPKHFGCDREEAERWFKLHQSALDGLPGVDTVRLEYRDEYVTGWLPLAADEGDTNG